MITKREKAGMHAILKQIEKSRLLNLYRTSTLKNEPEHDLIESILDSVTETCEMLDRKEIFKEDIVTYLQNQSIPASLYQSKYALIRKCRRLWSIPEKEWSNRVSIVESKKLITLMERKGLLFILNQLEKTRLHDLYFTSTKQEDKAVNKEKLEDILLSHEEAYEVLDRKDVLKEAIVAFLQSEGVSASEEETKFSVMRKCERLWKEF
ncbi:uncharacterized protein [Parasteatoda tepidariorum]|uniref:uncharacterized protein n=1 Tax=Parasteatoda tepidariorum TaxID=114398 RepID=UPI00077FD6B0|nr:uncharacterized protein LOC107444176 [Parasteatoda tepidariorum]